MKKTKTELSTIYDFNSVYDFVQYLENSPVNPVFQSQQHSTRSETGSNPWSGTHNYDEARDLLFHGWKPAAEKLNAMLQNSAYTPTRTTSFPRYDVVGGQASVPRYLQGLPTNMVNRVPKKVPEKIVIINKDITFHGGWSPEKMMQEGLKSLQIIQAIESTGARVRLNVIIGTSSFNWSKGDTNIIFRICLKSPDQRLNVASMAFPIAHPAFLRRIFFKAVEVTPELNKTDFVGGYGKPISIHPEKVAAMMTKNGEHFVPNEIKDLQEFLKNFSK